jgi:hypothetical protein
LDDGRRYMYDIIGMVSEAAIANKLPLPSDRKWMDHLFDVVLRILGKIPMDTTEPLIDALIAYAEALPSEQLLISFTALLSVLEKLDDPDFERVLLTEVEDDEERVAELQTYQRCCTKLSNALTGLSGKDGYPLLFGFPEQGDKSTKPYSPGISERSLLGTLFSWLTTGSPGREKTKAACLLLGNVAITDAACLELVQNQSLHKHAIAIIRNGSNNRELRFAAAQLLSHLAHPLDKEQRSTLWRDGYLEACAHLINPWSFPGSGETHLQTLGLYLYRLILRDNRILCQHLLGLPVFYHEERHDEYVGIALMPLMRCIAELDPKSSLHWPLIEQAARIVAVYARCLVKVGAGTKKIQEDEETLHLLEDSIILNPLTWVLQHTPPPTEEQRGEAVVLRETLFTFALIASCQRGSELIYAKLGPRGTARESARIALQVLDLSNIAEDSPDHPGAEDSPATDEQARGKVTRDEWKSWGHSLAEYILNQALHIPSKMLIFAVRIL